MYYTIQIIELNILSRIQIDHVNFYTLYLLVLKMLKCLTLIIKKILHNYRLKLKKES